MWGTLSAYLTLVSPVKVIGNQGDSPCTPGPVTELGIRIKKSTPVITKQQESVIYFIATESNSKTPIFGYIETSIFFHRYKSAKEREGVNLIFEGIRDFIDMEEDDLVILIPVKGNPKIYSPHYKSIASLEYENSLPSHS